MQPESFRHEALLYACDDDFLAAAVPFVEAGLAAGEPIMVALPGARLELLRDPLDGAADRVAQVDMEAIGANPARIIPAWQEFVAEHAGSGRRLRGIGEPIWPGRSAAELVECQLHESLLNVAFADAPPFWLLCPYDTRRLDAAVIDEAHRSHPVIAAHGRATPSGRFRPVEPDGALAGPPLPPPSHRPAEMRFDARNLAEVRRFARAHAEGLDQLQLDDLLLAVSEAATNSVRHATGTGRLRVWHEDGTLVCEIEDRGTIGDPLAGRRRPAADQTAGGWGLWIANATCDLVQVRTAPGRTVVRLHKHLARLSTAA